MNLTELLDQAVRRWPEKAAFLEGGSAVSYRQLVDRIDAAAVQLRQAGVTPSFRVGVRQPNSVAYVVTTFALWRLQAAAVPVPIECSEDEVANLVEAMQLGAIIHPAPNGAGESRSAEFRFQRLPRATPPDHHGLNIAFIRFTSGTTSSQKGVVLCHETVRDRVLAANKLLQIRPDDTVAWCLPMAHHFLVTIVLYLCQGATVALMPDTLAQTFLETVNRVHATVLYASPFHYALLARDRTGVQMPSVRLAVSTTCALPEAVTADFHARFKIPLAQALGVIELGLVTLNRKAAPDNWRSVGQPGPDFRVKIVTPDEQGCGEVAITGPGMFDAYAAPWRLRKEVLRDGWFFTGDIGRLDASGFLYLISRKTAVINLAGRKVFPEEIEAVLNRHPDVRESRVYGRPHAHLGEVVEAELVLQTPGVNLDAVRAFCRKHLAPYQMPTRFQVVNALPRTAVTGKIRRAAAVAQNG
jgi:long-chain acyl-CoA synthetase